MPVVDGVDIPPPPGGGANGLGRGPRRRPQQPRRPPVGEGPPPPIRRAQHGGGGLRGAVQLLPYVGAALLVCVIVWAAMRVILGAVGVVTTLGGATIEAASAASSAVSERIDGARSAMSAAVTPDRFPREARPPRPVQPVTRPATRSQGNVRPAASPPVRIQRPFDCSTNAVCSQDPESIASPLSRPSPGPSRTGAAPRPVDPSIPEPTRPSAAPVPTRVPVSPPGPLVRIATAPESNAHHSLARSGYEAARTHLASGDYWAAHARTEQTLRELISYHGRGAPLSEFGELRREGEELLARVVRACHAERSVLLARGESAPVCPT